MKKKKPYRRRHYFVKKELQLSFILKFFVLAIISSITGNIILYFLLNKEIKKTLYSAHLAIETSGEIIIPHLILINLIIIPLIVLICIIITRSYIKRISGPIFRFQKIADEITKGNLSLKVILRKGDRLIELQDKFNLMINELKNTINNMKSPLNEIKVPQNEINKLLLKKPENLKEIQEYLNLIFQSIESLNKKIEFFKFN
jgi:methyl-accepting chemotaxis protein